MPEKLNGYEVINLSPELGEDAPPAEAYLILNGQAFESDVDTLAKIGKELAAAKRRAKDGLGGRCGSDLNARELTRGVQGVLFDGEEKKPLKRAKG